MKKIIILIVIIIILIISIFIGKKYIFKSDNDIKNNEIETIKKDEQFSSLKKLSFEELDAKIKSNDAFIAYFAWPYNCGDSRLFELNSFNDYLKDSKIKDMIYLIDLDEYAPDALANDKLREPITKRFLIDTWKNDKSLSPMSLKAPQIIYYKDGKIQNLVTWTALNGDAKYGIKKELTDAFFNDIK